MNKFFALKIVQDNMDLWYVSAKFEILVCILYWIHIGTKIRAKSMLARHFHSTWITKINKMMLSIKKDTIFANIAIINKLEKDESHLLNDGIFFLSRNIPNRYMSKNYAFQWHADSFASYILHSDCISINGLHKWLFKPDTIDVNLIFSWFCRHLHYTENVSVQIFKYILKK